MRSIGNEVALRALMRWGGEPASLQRLQTSGNVVYRFRQDDEPWVLRLTDHQDRSPAQNAAEMEFVLHLERCRVAVATPRRSRMGKLVEVLESCSASVMSWVPGELVGPDSEHWREPFFREWGRTLGAIHAAAQSYTGPARWQWWEEDLFVEADVLIPRDDGAARDELALVLGHLMPLAKTSVTYGVTHADHGPQNFRYRPEHGITSFDFGNCCRHWYAMDLVIALSTLRRQPSRDDYREWMLAGYRERLPIDEEVWAQFAWFLRLRVLYVYLSRLDHFGPAPSAEQRTILTQLKALVAQPVEWS